MPDPRTLIRIRSANAELLNQAVRHAHFLERLKTSQANKLIGFLNDSVLPDISAKVSQRLEAIGRGMEVSEATTTRLRQLHSAVSDIIESGIKNGYDKQVRDSNDLATYEARWQLASIEAASPVTLSLIRPANATLQAIIKDRPFQGKLVRQWYNTLKDSITDKVKTQINIGIVQGESIASIMARLRGTRASGYKDGVLGCPS